MPRDVLVVVSSATLGDAKYRDVCVMSVCPFVRRRFRWEQVRVVHGLGWVGLGQTKWTRGQLWNRWEPICRKRRCYAWNERVRGDKGEVR